MRGCGATFDACFRLAISTTRVSDRACASSLPQDPSEAHPKLQPLYFVAACAAHATVLAGIAMYTSQAASLANSSTPAVAQSLSGRLSSAQLEQSEARVSLADAAGSLEGLLGDIRQQRHLLQHQLATLGDGLLTVRQMERELLLWLALVHTWAATPDGAYCGGRVDEQAAAAAQAAYNAALAMSDSDFCTSGLLMPLSNLLRRTGLVAEAEATLRRALSAARAAGDAFRELNAAASLASVIPSRDGWSYREVEGLVQAVHRCLQECKPWLPGPAWTNYREVRWAKVGWVARPRPLGAARVCAVTVALASG